MYAQYLMHIILNIIKQFHLLPATDAHDQPIFAPHYLLSTMLHSLFLFVASLAGFVCLLYYVLDPLLFPVLFQHLFPWAFHDVRVLWNVLSSTSLVQLLAVLLNLLFRRYNDRMLPTKVATD